MEHPDGTVGEVVLQKAALELTQMRTGFSFQYEEWRENAQSRGGKELEDSRN